MLMQMLNSLIEHTPVLAARRTVKTKWYIINRYNESHDDTMDENAVMIFLCDEQRGALTEEQRAFAGQPSSGDAARAGGGGVSQRRRRCGFPASTDFTPF